MLNKLKEGTFGMHMNGSINNLNFGADDKINQKTNIHNTRHNTVLARHLQILLQANKKF